MLAGILILVCWASLGVYWNISARSVKSAAEPQTFAGKLARKPVWLGFVLLVAAWVHPFFSDSMGVAICALGLFVAIWSRNALGTEWSRNFELKREHKLVQWGPYRFMRHPIYTGHLLMGLGTAIASGSFIAFVGLALFAWGFWIKMNQEESLLLRSFPDEYPTYKTRVKALIPYLF
jgi:protein-S-isoprenylcysteine O-methyltransferase Ste14